MPGGEGSAGSHWESRYMLGDYMISTDFPDAAMSDITLALFEDTGLYRVNYYSGGLFKFGKNKGCSFLNGACTNNGVAAFDDFCTTSGQPTCSSSRAIKTSCYTTEGGYPTADSCPVPYEYHTQSSYYPKHCRYGTSSDSLEKIGESSFCFMSSLSQGSTASSEKPVCYEVSCDTTNKKIIVTVGSATIICDDETVSNPSGLQGNIICPKYSDLCASSTSSGKVYNDMYNIFTKKAADDRYTYPTTFNDFTGFAYGLNVRAKQYIDRLWLDGMIGINRTNFKTNDIYINENISNNPNGMSEYARFSVGYDCAKISEFAISPFVGFMVQRNSVMDLVDTDINLHTGAIAKYDFVMDGIKYEYAANVSVDEQGDWNIGLKIGFMSVVDKAGAFASVNAFKDEFATNYKLSLNANIQF